MCDVIDKLCIHQAEVKLLVNKSERSGRLTESEGKKLYEKHRKSNFSEKSGYCRLKEKLALNVTGNSTIS